GSGSSIQIGPCRSNSRRARPELRYRRRVVLVAHAKGDIAVRVQEEPIPNAAGSADRSTEYKLESAAERTQDRRCSGSVVIIASERRDLIVAARYLMTRVEALKGDGAGGVIIILLSLTTGLSERDV